MYKFCKLYELSPTTFIWQSCYCWSKYLIFHRNLTSLATAQALKSGLLANTMAAVANEALAIVIRE